MALLQFACKYRNYNKDKPQSLINTQCPFSLLWNTNCLRLAFTAGNIFIRLQIVQVSLVTFSGVFFATAELVASFDQ